jgi:hypothetical protein
MAPSPVVGASLRSATAPRSVSFHKRVETDHVHCECVLTHNFVGRGAGRQRPPVKLIVRFWSISSNVLLGKTAGWSRHRPSRVASLRFGIVRSG